MTLRIALIRLGLGVAEALAAEARVGPYARSKGDTAAREVGDRRKDERLLLRIVAEDEEVSVLGVEIRPTAEAYERGPFVKPFEEAVNERGP